MNPRILFKAIFPTVAGIAFLFAAPALRAVEEKPAEAPALNTPATSLVPMDKEDAYQETINEAMAEFEAERYDDALVLLEKAYTVYPRDPFLLNLKGAVFTKLKNWDEATRFFNRALNEDGQFFPARFNLGEVLFLQGKKEEALAYFESLNQMYARNELIEFKLVLLFLLTERTADAERILSRMQYPGNGPAWYYASAAMASARGDKREARRYLSAAKGLFDEKTLALFNESMEESGLNP
jgi:Flp pilus assembly protein TadD